MSEIAKAYKVLFENGQIAMEDIPDEIREELFPELKEAKKEDTKNTEKEAETVQESKHTNPWD